MKTALREYTTSKNHIVRAILSMPDAEAETSVIYLHGFERCASTEKKFKALADGLLEKRVAGLRLDFSGCGLSDGDFRSTTIADQADEFVLAMQELKQEMGHKKTNIVAHSLGACVLAHKIDDIKEEIEKIILIAPALNQKDLMRYRFVKSQLNQSNAQIEITWKNYKQYLDEAAFQKDCEKNDKMTKRNYIDSSYFLATKEYDYTVKFESIQNKILHIHGSKDLAVPIESLHTKFDNKIIVPDGNHDLEKPNQFEQWKKGTIDFLVEG